MNRNSKSTGFPVRFVSVAVLLVAIAAGCRPSAPERAGEQTLQQGTASLTVHFDGRRDDFSGQAELTAAMTALDLLVKVAADHEVDVQYRGQGETAFVEAIGGIEGGADGNPWWIYKINGKTAETGSGTLKLKPGDEVVWQLGRYPDPDDGTSDKPAQR